MNKEQKLNRIFGAFGAPEEKENVHMENLDG